VVPHPPHLCVENVAPLLLSCLQPSPSALPQTDPASELSLHVCPPESTSPSFFLFRAARLSVPLFFFLSLTLLAPYFGIRAPVSVVLVKSGGRRPIFPSCFPVVYPPWRLRVHLSSPSQNPLFFATFLVALGSILPLIFPQLLLVTCFC